MRRTRLIVAFTLALGAALASGLALGAPWGLATGGTLASWVGICVLLFDSRTQTLEPRPTPSFPHSDEGPVSAPDELVAVPDVPEEDGHENEHGEEPGEYLSPDAPIDDGPTDDEPHAHEPIPSAPAPSIPEPGAEGSSETDPQPLPDETEEEDEAPHPSTDFSFPDFAKRLVNSSNPMAELIDFCKKTAENDLASPFEHYLARRLSEADIEAWDKEPNAPEVELVTPHHSGTFYIREESRISLGFHLRVLRAEAALNAALTAYNHYDDPLLMSVEELMRFEQRVASTICAQATDVTSSDWSYLAMPWQSGVGPSQRGEWAVRNALSESIETLQVPHRLEASFRTNVSGGDVAIEIRMTPARAFPRSTFVDGLGIVPTTSHMRRRYASAYAGRVGILLANCAFRASDRIRRVWVAGIHSTPNARKCLYWMCVERRSFAHVRMDAVNDPLNLLARLGATLAVDNEVLQPVTQGFYLEDERFCPPLRHDLWRLSERALPPAAAISLGTQRVSGLSIHEELARTLVAEEALRCLATDDDRNATQLCVRSLLDAARRTSDIDVWQATERVAAKLITGALAPSNLDALEKELVSGDHLTRTVEQAHHALEHERPEEALEQLLAALRSLDGKATYQDTQSAVYRSFDSFAQRALYNRLNTRDRRCVILVPDAYVVAHLLAASILLARSQAQRDKRAREADAREALAHARRAQEVAPLSAPAIMSTVACLERSGDLSGATNALVDMLELAHDPQGIALAYYRMASMQWQLNHHEACLACYQLAAGFSPTFIPMIVAECSVLSTQDPRLTTPLEPNDVKKALREAGIPLAPTPRMSFLLYDCAAASIDAEVFPVAHDLMRILESFTGDDVLHGIRRSLEHEPDA